MKKLFKRTSILLASAFIGVVALQAQKAPQDMNRFIDALMKKMTVEEKIGQLNLPAAGDITTGQAKSSNIAKNIEQGMVGGLFNSPRRICNPPDMSIRISKSAYITLYK